LGWLEVSEKDDSIDPVRDGLVSTLHTPDIKEHSRELSLTVAAIDILVQD
jgi:hypothetical protein